MRVVAGRFDPFFEEDFVRSRCSGKKSFFLVRLLPRTAKERLALEVVMEEGVMESRERERLRDRERLVDDLLLPFSESEVGSVSEWKADPTKGVAAM